VQPVVSSSDLEGFDIRLIDFGLAKVMTGKRMRDREKIGTYTHMAPEVIEGVYTTKCDLWSTGILLHILLVGSCPFKGKNKQTTFDNIRT
jgi:calcium-dependent protein kinase